MKVEQGPYVTAPVANSLDALHFLVNTCDNSSCAKSYTSFLCNTLMYSIAENHR